MKRELYNYCKSKYFKAIKSDTRIWEIEKVKRVSEETYSIYILRDLFSYFRCDLILNSYLKMESVKFYFMKDNKGYFVGFNFILEVELIEEGIMREVRRVITNKKFNSDSVDDVSILFNEGKIIIFEEKETKVIDVSKEEIDVSVISNGIIRFGSFKGTNIVYYFNMNLLLINLNFKDILASNKYDHSKNLHSNIQKLEHIRINNKEELSEINRIFKVKAFSETPVNMIFTPRREEIENQEKTIIPKEEIENKIKEYNKNRSNTINKKVIKAIIKGKEVNEYQFKLEASRIISEYILRTGISQRKLSEMFYEFSRTTINKMINQPLLCSSYSISYMLNKIEENHEIIWEK